MTIRPLLRRAFCALAITAVFGALLAAPARATTAIVVDVDTGTVLHAERADQPWYPASITKLMTAYVAFDVLNASLDIAENTPARWSDHANAQEPTKLWLLTGTELPLGTAIGAMIVKSANDAATMVAETAGGALADFTRYGACRKPDKGSRRERSVVPVFAPAPDPMDLFALRRSGLGAARFDDARTPWVACRHDAFIARMNATARQLGMSQTRFANANGLPDARQVTTARDFAKLARALIREHPRYAPVFKARSMRYRGRRLRSYNALLRTFAGANGMKTGFICAGGYNIVASAERDGRRLLTVVLGWSSASARNARAAALLAHGFALPRRQLAPHGFALAELPQSGDARTPPPDIRASLRSRSCRRTPWGRVRFVARAVDVRTLAATPLPKAPDVPHAKPGTRNAKPASPKVRRKRAAKKTKRVQAAAKPKKTLFPTSDRR